MIIPGFLRWCRISSIHSRSPSAILSPFFVWGVPRVLGLESLVWFRPSTQEVSIASVEQTHRGHGSLKEAQRHDTLPQYNVELATCRACIWTVQAQRNKAVSWKGTLVVGLRFVSPYEFKNHEFKNQRSGWGKQGDGVFGDQGVFSGLQPQLDQS